MRLFNRKTLNIIFLAIPAFTAPLPVFAKHVLPVFAGFWYTDASASFVTACNQNIYKYANQKEGDAKSVATALLDNNKTKHPDCSWNDAYLKDEKTIVPSDFISSNADWQQIVAEQSNPRSQEWESVCLDSQGQQKDLVNVTINPSYMCPTGSRYSLYDFEEPSEQNINSGFCSTKPLVCISDIALRNLRTEQFKEYGHVGLTEYSKENKGNFTNLMLEVKDSGPTIQLNTFESFYEPVAEYKGLRYGTNDVAEFSLEQANNIFKAGLDERTCDDVSYTSSWNWHACKFDKKQGKKTAVFRCDSFVLHSYLQGAGVTITKYKFPVAPRDLFYKMKSARFDGILPADITYLSNTDLFRAKIHQAFNVDAAYQEQNITNIFTGKAFDQLQADRATYQYATDEKISRDKKIRFFWSLATTNINDTMRFNYLMSCLGFLNPIELTDNLIEAYKIENNAKNKIVILNVLADDVSDEAIAEYKFATTQTDKTKQFFADLLFKEIDLTVLAKTVFFAGHIFEPEIAKSYIDKALQRKDIDTKALEHDLFHRAAFYTLQLDLIFSSPEMQKKHLPTLLTAVAKLKTFNLFNESLYYYFTDTDFYPPKFGFDSSKIDNSIRPLLLDYMQRNKPHNFVADHAPDFSVFSPDYANYQWLTTFMAVKAHNVKEKNRMIADYIRGTSDLADKSILLFYAPQSVYEQFSSTEMISMRTILQEKFASLKNTSQQNGFENMYIAIGISKLDKFTIPGVTH